MVYEGSVALSWIQNDAQHAWVYISVVKSVILPILRCQTFDTLPQW